MYNNPTPLWNIKQTMPTSRQPPHPPRCFDQSDVGIRMCFRHWRQPQRESNKPGARENPRYLEVEVSSRRPGGCGGFRLPPWFAPSRARFSRLGVCAVQQWVGAAQLAWQGRGVALFRPGRKEGARGVLLSCFGRVSPATSLASVVAALTALQVSLSSAFSHS